jgi:hypothetical protein
MLGIQWTYLRNLNRKPLICSPPIVFLAISLGKKCWQTNGGIEIWLNQWGDAACTKRLMCFLLGRVRGSEFLSCWCSQCVLNGLTPSSQKVHQVPNVFLKMFPITSHFYPIWFCPKLSSIHLYRWVKGEIWYFHNLGIETSIVGSFQCFSIAAYDIKMTLCK